MTNKRITQILAILIFLIAITTYSLTISPTVAFWDVGEYCATAYMLQVPHPPGAPLSMIMAKVVSLVPFTQDLAVRMNWYNALASALTMSMFFLITLRLMRFWREDPETSYDRLVFFGSATIGVLAMTFSMSWWFLSLEFAKYNVSVFMSSLIIWAAFQWHEGSASEENTDRYLLLIAFLTGLTVGVHLLGILVLFITIMIVYFRNYKKTLKEFFTSTDCIKFGVVAALLFWAVYPGIIKYLPSMFAGDFLGVKSDLWQYVGAGIILAAIYGVWYSIKMQKRILHLVCLSFLLIILGFSIFGYILIRANANPPVNENNPNDMKSLVQYLNRDQYGDTPFLKRRFNMDPELAQTMSKYKSDWDFFLKYQMNHMYIRYFGWNFIGRESDIKESGVTFKDFYAIPLLLGFIGLFYHWRKSPKWAFIMTTYFLMMGIILAVYFNMQEPQPRERDYFFIVSFLIFCMWIGFSVLAIADFLKSKLSGKKLQFATYGIIALVTIFVPGNMLRLNYHREDRTSNYLPWDFSYNLLQSCEKDGILFTNGDNDTFPLWYMQDAMGVRRDVRIICLSLANTSWYVNQLKHSAYYGSKPVPISISDNFIETIQPIQYESKIQKIFVPKEVRDEWNAGRANMFEWPEGTPENVKQQALMQIPTAVDTVTFLMKNTLQYGETKGLRVQDIVMYDIIRTNQWKRPIHFSITVGPDSRIGLDNFIQLSGLAWKVVPAEVGRNLGGRVSYINDRRMHSSLMNTIASYSTEPQDGFLWRGLNDSTANFDENTRNMMLYYRGIFMEYANFVENVKGTPQELSDIFNRINSILPPSVIPFDVQTKFTMAIFYKKGGDTAKSLKLFEDVILELQSKIESAGTSRPNTYVMLLEAHEELGNYDEALKVLEQIKIAFAGAGDLDKFINEHQQKIAALRAITAKK